MRESSRLQELLLKVRCLPIKEVHVTNLTGGSVPGGGDGSEFEMIKEVLLDTNPYLLGTTVIVSIFHMIFEMLAFKSDISHYRNKKNNVGISVRSILGNVFMQGVIFLYLMDNNENTSKLSPQSPFPFPSC
jgi:hypothetical protein